MTDINTETDDANIAKIRDAMLALNAAHQQLHAAHDAVQEAALAAVRTIASIVQPTAVRLHCDWREDEPDQITPWAWELPDGEVIGIWDNPDDDIYELSDAVMNLRSWEVAPADVRVGTSEVSISDPHPYVDLNPINPKPEEAP